MSCSHCSAIEQKGRFCVGCGKLMPPSATPPRRVRVAPRPPMDDDTQPVLRFRVNGRPTVHAAPRPAAPRVTASAS